jgi:cobalamin biosynthesis Mg chelatase CobN
MGCKVPGRARSSSAKRRIRNLNQKGDDMDASTIIRVIAGMLFVVVLAVVIWRRKRTA